MKKRLIVLRNGRPIFECPIEREQADRTSVSAAFDECRRQHPELNLFDPEISARLETVEGWKGLFVPIRFLEKYGPVYEAEDISNVTAAYEAALRRLGVSDRADPMTATVANLIIGLAQDGERDPKKLCDRAVKVLLN
jgi:hypothetical protein